MNLPLQTIRFSGGLLVAALLASCGGGGGSPGATPGPAPVPPPVADPAPPRTCTGVEVLADTTVEAGEMASATVLACTVSLSTVSWTQVGGPAVTLLASRSPTVAFETAASGAGTVRLRADAVLAGGTAFTATTEIVVGAAPAGSSITVRADHSVRPGMSTSVRAWPTLLGGETVTGIVWTQVAGPTVTMDTANNKLLMFEAPKVAIDTALKFRATMTTSSGRQDSDEVTVGIETQGTVSADSLFDATERVHPYRSASLYAGVLERCTYATSIYYTSSSNNNLCTAGTLPLLQAEAGPGNVPSVAQIMGRVLVSHDFLGTNFEAFLTTQDQHGDFRRLLAGATSIVLGSHVRPSFYQSATGAIYLDAFNLWFTPEQRDLVTEVPDYRSAFDDALNYSNFGRVVKNNAYARRSYPATSRITRTTDELVFELGRLLYHELGHAGDFFEPSERDLNPSATLWSNVSSRIGARTLASDALAAQYPLMSVEMKGMGQVLYQGATANAVQKAYTGADIGRFFSSDRASDDYAYSINGNTNSREDLAMLFEEFMMYHRHGARYDIAFTNVYRDGMSAGDVLVGWGMRGRIAEAAIKPRIKLVLSRIAPWIDQGAVDTLPAPILMTAGASWDANLVLGTPASPAPPITLLSNGYRRDVAEDLKRPMR